MTVSEPTGPLTELSLSRLGSSETPRGSHARLTRLPDALRPERRRPTGCRGGESGATESWWLWSPVRRLCARGHVGWLSDHRGRHPSAGVRSGDMINFRSTKIRKLRSSGCQIAWLDWKFGVAMHGKSLYLRSYRSEGGNVTSARDQLRVSRIPGGPFRVARGREKSGLTTSVQASRALLASRTASLSSAPCADVPLR